MDRCYGCAGKGIVNWSSRYASKEPTSGEIRIENITICGVCHGHGMQHIAAPMWLDISVEEYEEKFGSKETTQSIEAGS